MAARELLDVSLLLLALVCSGCVVDDSEWVDDAPLDPDPRACEVEVVSEAAPPSAESRRGLSPTADVRMACGGVSVVLSTSVGIGAAGVYVVTDELHGYDSQFWLYRLDHLHSHEDTIVTPVGQLSDEPYWANLQVDDGGIVSLFWQVERSMLFGFMPSTEDWPVEPLAVEAGWITRVEIAGSQPHLWYDDVHATASANGTWLEQPARSVEGMETVAIGLDGSGNQLAYALGGDDSSGLWTFDGASTEFGQLQQFPFSIIPVPMAHPTNPSHEHAAVMPSFAGVELVWPRRESGTMVIPTSSTYVDAPDKPYESCLLPSDVVAARTSDGRVWLAWIVNVLLPFCADDSSVAAENGTLRLIEVDPASTQPLEVMRVQLDTDNLSINSEGYGFTTLDTYDGELSLAAFGQQLVLVVADGPEHARLRVISVDTSR